MPIVQWVCRGCVGGTMVGMADAMEKRAVSTTTFQSWVQQGEQLYAAALQEFQAIEAQIEDLESKLAAKQDELNKIAQMIGKSPVDGNRRGAIEVLDGQIVEDMPTSRSPNSSSNATIARALTGKFGR